MRGWVALACVVLGLFLLSLVRIGAVVEYGATGFSARIRAGALRFQVYPIRRKKKRGEKTRKKEKAVRSGKEVPPAERPGKEGGGFAAMKSYFPLVTEVAGKFKQKLRIDELLLDFTAAAPDPASAAMAFGGANALAGMILPILENHFNIRSRRIRTAVDFQLATPIVYLYAALSLSVGQAVALALRIGIRFLKITLQQKNTRKEKQKEAV